MVEKHASNFVKFGEKSKFDEVKQSLTILNNTTHLLYFSPLALYMLLGLRLCHLFYLVVFLSSFLFFTCCNNFLILVYQFGCDWHPYQLEGQLHNKSLELVRKSRSWL